MNLDDGRVCASSGDMLADGTFDFEGAEAPQFLHAAHALIAVRSGPGRHGTRFELVANARRDADGLWSAGSALHSVSFQSTLPPLDQLLDFPSFALSSEGVPSDVTRFELSAEHSAFAWVAFDTVYGPDRRRDALLGTAASVKIEARRTGDGFTFVIEARVDEPKTWRRARTAVDRASEGQPVVRDPRACRLGDVVSGWGRALGATSGGVVGTTRAGVDA